MRNGAAPIHSVGVVSPPSGQGGALFGPRQGPRQPPNLLREALQVTQPPTAGGAIGRVARPWPTTCNRAAARCSALDAGARRSTHTFCVRNFVPFAEARPATAAARLEPSDSTRNSASRSKGAALPNGRSRSRETLFPSAIVFEGRRCARERERDQSGRRPLCP